MLRLSVSLLLVFLLIPVFAQGDDANIYTNEGISLTLPAQIAAEPVFAIAEEEPFFRPHRVAVTFPEWPHTGLEATIDISLSAAYNDTVGYPILDSLKTYLENPVEPEIIIGPLYERNTLFTGLPELLDFQNGTGIRWVGIWEGTPADDVAQYIYAGLSTDDTYYVLASLPVRVVDADLLARMQQGDDMTAESIPADAFDPPLAAMDALFTSLLVEPTGETQPPPHILAVDGVQITVPRNLAETVTAEYVPEIAPGRSDSAPEHLRFALDMPELGMQHTINVYSTEAYMAITGRTLDSLTTLLDDRPDLNTLEAFNIPGPSLNAGRRFIARPQYVEFDGGSGIAYIGFWTQDYTPVRLRHVFVGFSDDRSQYIEAVFPMFSEELRTDYTMPSMGTVPYTDEVLDAYSDYVQAAADFVDSADASAFTPNLDDITQVLGSLVLGEDISCSSLTEPRLAPGQAGEVMAADAVPLLDMPDVSGDVLAELAPGTEFIAWYGPACTDAGSLWLVIADGQMGWLQEANGQDFLLEPVGDVVSDLPPRPRDGDGPVTVDALGIQFELSANFAISYEASILPPQPDEFNPDLYAHPLHRSIDWLNYTGGEDEAWHTFKVHPTADWEAITGRSLDDLRELLADPTLDPYPTGTQRINAARMYTFYVDRLDFQNGSGVRFIAQWTQSGTPPWDGALVYYFAGLTDDGEHLVHIAFPLDSVLIPAEDVLFDTFDFDAFLDYDNVNESLGLLFETAPIEAFYPLPTDLDALVATLQIGPMPDFCGELPSQLEAGDIAVQILENDPLRVRDAPATGTVTRQLSPGDEVAVLSGPECVDDLVWWEVGDLETWSGWIAESVGDTYFIAPVE